MRHERDRAGYVGQCYGGVGGRGGDDGEEAEAAAQAVGRLRPESGRQGRGNGQHAVVGHVRSRESRVVRSSRGYE